MHRKLLIFIILFSYSINNIDAQARLESELKNFPISNYLNKPIDTFLSYLPPGYDTAFTILPGKYFYMGASLEISYGTEFWVNIGIIDPQFITVYKNPVSLPSKLAWPLHLLRKEKVGRITIFKVPGTVILEGDIYN